MAQLPSLESLEIGDCVQWTEPADYEMLGKLTHLRHLRLEKGPAENVLHHLEASLSSIMGSLQHLELVNFTVDAPLATLTLAGLKRLLIIPRYKSEVRRS